MGRNYRSETHPLGFKQTAWPPELGAHEESGASRSPSAFSRALISVSPQLLVPHAASLLLEPRGDEGQGRHHSLRQRGVGGTGQQEPQAVWSHLRLDGSSIPLLTAARGQLAGDWGRPSGPQGPLLWSPASKIQLGISEGGAES